MTGNQKGTALELIDTPRALGAAVASARKARELTQGQLAKDIGISRQLVNRLEMGTAPGISFATVLAILERLDYALFVRGTDEPDSGMQRIPESVVRSSPSDEAPDSGALPYPASLYTLDASLFQTPRREG